jgi:hypothetical protein
MSLFFGGATSHRVSLGSPTILDNTNPTSVIVFVYPATVTAGATMYSKISSAGIGRRFKIDTGSGPLNWRVSRPTSTNYTTAAAVITAAAHQCFCAVYNPALTPVVHIYKGTPSSGMAEVSYNTTTDGAGTVGPSETDDTFLAMIGNDESLVRAFTGDISMVAVFNKVLTIPEMDTIRAMTLSEAQAWDTTPLVSGCIGFWLLDSATVVTDLSGQGNNGTVTGATLGSEDWWDVTATRTRTVSASGSIVASGLSTPVITSPTAGQLVDASLTVTWTAST